MDVNTSLCTGGTTCLHQHHRHGFNIIRMCLQGPADSKFHALFQVQMLQKHSQTSLQSIQAQLYCRFCCPNNWFVHSHLAYFKLKSNRIELIPYFGQFWRSLRISMVFESQSGAIRWRSRRWIMIGTWKNSMNIILQSWTNINPVNSSIVPHT